MYKPRQERTIGDTYERAIKGIVYLVEYTGVRKYRIVSRITPPSCPQRANNRGKDGNVNIDTRSNKNKRNDELPNMLKLKGSEKIRILENSRRKKVRIQVKPGMWVEVYGEDVEATILKYKKTA